MEKSEFPSLSEKEKEEIRSLYEGRLKEHGISPQTVGWSSIEQQTLRFQVLSEIGNLDGSSVCDVGCGLGDMMSFFDQRSIRLSYTGIDICPGFIETARPRFPDCQFLVADILTDPVPQSFDWVFLSGALNYRVSDNWNFTRAMLKRMFTMAKKGVACNFLSTYVDYEAPINFHHKPEDVFTFGRKLTKYVTLRHDYPLWEFTLYLKK